MAVTINSNSAASIAARDLSKANDALRRSLARLSSGNRIVDSRDDPGGMSVAYKLSSRLNRTSAIKTNVQNAQSFLQVQDGALQSAGKVVSRMSELRAMAMDVTKNLSDIEHYTKEFIELQKHLAQLYQEKFNGVSLFAVSGADQSLPEATPGLHKQVITDLAGDAKIFLSRRLLTHDSGSAENGNVSIGVINFEDVFNLGALDTKYVNSFKGTDPNLANPLNINSSYNTDGVDSSNPTDAPEGAAYVEFVNGANSLRFYSKAESQSDGNSWRLFISDNTGNSSLTVVHPGETVSGLDNSTTSETHYYLQLENEIVPGAYTTDFVSSISDASDYFAISLSGSSTDLYDYISSGGTSLSDTDMNGEPGRLFSGGYIPSGYSEVFTEDGYISNILFVSMGQFTSVIENIADARAENGAEQNRLLMIDDLLSSNMTNLEAAHGRIMDADIALESAKFAQRNVLVQAAASMVAQANQLSNIALTILGR
jgi:flagellin